MSKVEERLKFLSSFNNQTLPEIIYIYIKSNCQITCARFLRSNSYIQLLVKQNF